MNTPTEFANDSRSTVNVILLIIALLVAVFFTLTRVDKALRIKAVDECGKISRYETAAQDGSKTSAPIDAVYQKCMKDKGY